MTLSERDGPLQIEHLGQFPSISISFNLAPGASLGSAVDAIRQAEADVGLPASFNTAYQGALSAFQKSLSNELMLIAAAVAAVYIVLGVLYESFLHPITILSTLPSAGVGALLALRLVGDDFDIIAIIGVILLIGIVKKNAIMMIDFALEAQRVEGKSPRDAIHQACLLRFRPILMTTMAALLGALPLMLGQGTGSELRQPLGICIVGGLLVSQLLTLFTTPVVYLAIDRDRRPLPSRRRARCGGRGHSGGVTGREPLRALHRPSGSHHAADDRHSAGGLARLFRAPGISAAAGRFSHHQGDGAIAGRQSGCRRDEPRGAIGAPSR